MSRPRTLGELKASGWRSRSVKDELRANVIARLRSGDPLFPGIVGYENTVEPQIVNALLSKHDFILLGLRGQAKTRLLRALSSFLDEWVPAIDGCPLNSDPYEPLTHHARQAVEVHGDATPIRWLHRDARYQEKLATPDVTIADLIGDIDPIKAATLRLDYSDERVIHYGILPRTNRGIFAINELPDLQPRIQVGLLNILEEKDFQIRGFPVRIPLDVAVVFSANPEDYTNRGNIITPLRDRINSQIITHYPLTREQGMAITSQEAWAQRDSGIEVVLPAFMRELVEEVAIQARKSEYVDQNSGVSARLPIALLENLVSNAERRALRTGEKRVVTRVCDLQNAVSAVSGKVELVLEGEQEGALAVAKALLGRGVKAVFQQRFPDAFKARGRRRGQPSPENEPQAASEYRPILEWFAGGQHLRVGDDMPAVAFEGELSRVAGLADLAKKYLEPRDLAEHAVAMELVLEGMHQNSMLSRERTDAAVTEYKDMLKSMLSGLGDD
ncbi:MAG: sigma 54-interacting transcriptional regulator [Candidatus Eisenbacteria bacterium]|uniref:Sigma 54-interacting transcriptional regulator n=1 Tax=Eiseniibacteriota bacterium TaxID=2212470 RepID=A0A933SAW1_UNCEI|nr:sigma 54-interacting transcriptional regulator [Candidatus Eisenbacteria bacterium]